MFCQNCGTENPEGSAFCKGCGSALKIAPAPAAEPVVEPVAATPVTEIPNDTQTNYTPVPTKDPGKGFGIAAMIMGLAVGVTYSGAIVIPIGAFTISLSGLAVGALVGILYRKNVAEAKIGTAEKKAKEVVEEAAYTWFNRLMAVKIMQENGWIDRVLDFESEGVRVPLLVANARRGVLPAMSVSREQGLRELLEYDTKTTEQFNLLITDFCKGVPVINKCFGKISDYTELLLPTDVLSDGGIVDMINHTEFISEDDFKQSELIGWLYQFYISEKKDAVFASFKDKKKAEAEDIPAATQIFTPK